MQSQDGADVAVAEVLLVVGVDEEGQHRAADAGGRLDHVRDVARAVLLDDLDLLARAVAVGLEVEVAAVGDALQL